MPKEIRTPKGKLIGVLCTKTNIFKIKDGKKVTSIFVPPEGLRIQFQFNESLSEKIYIPAQV